MSAIAKVKLMEKTMPHTEITLIHPQPSKSLLQLKHVSKAYGDRLLIDNLSFRIPPGAIVGIIMKVSSQLREGRYVPYGPFLAGAGLGIMLAGPQKVLEWLGWA